jgi:hypothetical protein
MYDVDRRGQVGNFPQTFSHLALIEAAHGDHDGRRASARNTGGRPARHGIVVAGAGDR